MLARLSRVVAAVAAIGVGAVLSVAAPANAALTTSFSMAPTSGPGGTVVSVSGSGCAPGVMLSASLDNVVVSVASAPPVSKQFPVSSSGAWSGSLTIPANAAAGPAVVSPVCVTDGTLSLATIYSPKTFTVTASGAPTTTTKPQPTTTVPGSVQPPPVTAPHVGSTTPTTHPGSTPATRPNAGGPVAGTPGGGPDAPGVGSTDPGSRNATGHAKAKASSGKRAVSVAADLEAPSMGGGDARDGGHGLGWIGWLALALLLGGVVTGAVLFRRFRPDDAAADA